MQPLRIAIYADGANLETMANQARIGLVQGFTTNPTLMAKAKISDYTAFAKAALMEIRDLPISFEVFADDLATMEQQALTISSWGKNVYIKIPITNTEGTSTLPLIRKLLDRKCQLNITAILAENQITGLREIIHRNDPAIIVSIFAGRIADTGVDPVPIMLRAVALYRDLPQAKILWASPREVLNIYQAEACGCHIITVTPELLAKLPMRGQSLEGLSLDTVKMFYRDATNAGFTLCYKHHGKC